jgi:hypothetical protein
LQGWKGTNNVPLAEVKMDSVELASKIRRQLCIKREFRTLREPI